MESYQAIPSPPSHPSASHGRKRPKDYIRRPPNAFLLYRSDFLKRDLIPKHEERQQQNLSRIIGKCWRRLPADEKAEWHARARVGEAEHAIKYPKYSYKPVRRGNIRRRRQKGSEEEKIRRCEELRKTFLPETMDQFPESHEPRKTRKSRVKKKIKPQSVVSTGSLSPDGQFSAVAFANNAFMEPLLAPATINQQSLEELHASAAPESSASYLDFFNPGLGQYEQYPAYNDEYYHTLGMSMNNVAPLAGPAISQLPVASGTTSTMANELYERFRRDEAARAATTMAMFNAQYIDQSFFAPQSSFFPVQQAGPSSAFTNTSDANFQDLFLPPSCFPFEQSGLPQIQGPENIASSATAMNFPFTMQSNVELPDLSLVYPVFNPPTDTSDLNIDLGNLDIFSAGLN